MRAFVWVLEFSLILFHWHTTKVAAISQFRFFEVSAQSLEVLVDLMGQLSGMAGNDGLMGIISLAFSWWHDLVENGDHEDSCFTHSRFGLTENISPLECKGDGFDLNLTRMFESAFPDCAFELVLQEEFVPASEIGALVAFVGVDLRLLLFIRALIIGRHNLIHDSYSFQKNQYSSYLNSSNIIVTYLFSKHTMTLSKTKNPQNTKFPRNKILFYQ